jgi:gamma-glutamyltranspeptidase
VVDRDGNAVSMTTTIESGFGARLMTEGGFLLNNELTDFAFAPEEEGRPVANRVEPGKRPRSSMDRPLCSTPSTASTSSPDRLEAARSLAMSARR